MPRTGRLATPDTGEAEEAGMHETVNRAAERRMRNGIRSHCRDQLEACVSDSGSAMTHADVDKWMDSLEERNLGGETEDEKTQVAMEMARHTQEFIRQTRVAGEIIDRAERAKWILSSKAAEWRAKMKKGTWEEKKDFITGTDTSPDAHTLRAFARNWEQIAAEYKDVLGQEKKLGIRQEEITKYKELSLFHDPAMMSGKLNYWARKARVDAARDFLKSYRPGMQPTQKKNKEELEILAIRELMKAVRAKALDEGRGMHWLETKVLTKPAKELEKYISVDLKAYVANCVETRVAYDHIEGQMQKQGVPQGFNRLSPVKFLAMTLNQRKSYVRMAKERLEEKEANKDPELGNLKLGVRNAMETKDWEEAEGFLKKARALMARGRGTLADKSDLDSMERYLRDFRGKKKNQPDENIRKTLENMRDAFEQVPDSLQNLYLGAMNDSYECASTVFRTVYNLKWATERGYCDPNRMAVLRESAKEETDRRAKGEHGKKGVENVDLSYVSDPGHVTAVRSYTAGEWAPTYIHMQRGQESKALDLAKAHKDNNAYGYWVILDPIGVPQEKIVSLVENVHWKLKSGMRKLQKVGMRFTRTGEPVSVN